MAATYFPNPLAAMPEPRFTAPQQDFAPVLGSALQSLTGVANNYRQKQMSVQSAEKMASALEAEGLTQEAGMYRKAAQAYDVNFFSTPEQNEQFNRTLLTDSLKLLQQSRENKLKEQAQSIQNEYYKGLISSRGEASADRATAASERSADRQMALAETRRRNQAYILGSRMDDVRAEAKAIQDELGSMQSSVQKGTLDAKDRATLERAARLQGRLKQIGEEYNQYNAQLRATMSADENGNSGEEKVSQFNPFYREGNPLAGFVPAQEIKAQELQSNIGFLNENPNLGRVGTVSTQRPGSRMVENGPNGTITRETTPLPIGQGTGIKPDPKAPNVFNANSLSKPPL
jgi:hypothetical protein